MEIKNKIKVGTVLIAIDDCIGNLIIGKEYPVKELHKDDFCIQSEHLEGLHYFTYSGFDKFFKFKEEDFKTPKHYDNSKGSLYKVAKERNWNAYLFDIVKRLERSEKKGEFKTDLEKSKLVIDLWLKES